MVKDINSGSNHSGPARFAAVGNTLYFSANDGINGGEMWKSDGTNDGTVMVNDIRSGSDGSDIRELTPFGNKLFFTANDGTNGRELFMLDIHHEITYS